MRLTSLYCAECLCGRYFETELTEYTCPNCQRIIVLGRKEEPTNEPATASKPTEEAV
jgi:DNA-directed RNA polymerase subunit RPC12/RpoP